MSFKTFALAALGAALTSAGAVALAVQEEGLPAPAPEHRHLLERVGTWDCAMQLWAEPGDPMTAKGVEVARAIGDFHVVSDFSADMMGMPFVGHGIESWDPAKERYVTMWVDSLEPTPSVLEGVYDAKARTVTLAGEATMMGERMPVRQVVTLKDADHRTFDMFVTPPGAEEMQTLRIEYTRRK